MKVKRYNEFINETVSTFVSYDVIELIKKDIIRSKEFIQTKLRTLEELAVYLTQITKKYDVVFYTYKDFPELKGSPAFINGKNIITILLQPDVFSIMNDESKWDNWINRLEDSLVHEMTHQQDSLNSKRPSMESSDLENELKYFSSTEEIRAYANEQMNKFKRYDWDKEYIENILKSLPFLKCKGCKIWNYYLQNFKGTETFEWFLKCCYEYLERYIKINVINVINEY